METSCARASAFPLSNVKLTGLVMSSQQTRDSTAAARGRLHRLQTTTKPGLLSGAWTLDLDWNWIWILRPYPATTEHTPPTKEHPRTQTTTPTTWQKGGRAAITTATSYLHRYRAYRHDSWQCAASTAHPRPVSCRLRCDQGRTSRSSWSGTRCSMRNSKPISQTFSPLVRTWRNNWKMTL